MEKDKKNRTDAELLSWTLGGDMEAFGALYDRWSGTVYRFALRLSGEQSIAEDVTQDLFVALLRDGHQYEGRGKFSSYLLTMARHLVLHRLRRDRRFSPLETDDEDFDQYPTGPADLANPAPDPWQDLARVEVATRVRQAIFALPLHYREVVLLCYLHELSYAEAAEVIGCNIGTICSRLSRARALLAPRLRLDAGGQSGSGERTGAGPEMAAGRDGSWAEMVVRDE
ncbi:MAG: RNA polymerase sigma factor [Acidobacteriota bacterium]|jgi:RNA polymerase sigma-70 factor (ECF subfamily)